MVHLTLLGRVNTVTERDLLSRSVYQWELQHRLGVAFLATNTIGYLFICCTLFLALIIYLFNLVLSSNLCARTLCH